MPLKFKLKVQLAIKEMTQKQLAEVTGIRPPTVSSICTGTVKQIPVSAIEKICHALSCQPGDIMEYVPNDESEGLTARVYKAGPNGMIDVEERI